MLIEALLCMTSMSSVATACHEDIPQPDPIELHYALEYHPPQEEGVEVVAASYESRDVWWELGECESGNDPTTDTGNGYSGMLQWSPNSWDNWRDDDDPSYAADATAQQEIEAAERYRDWEIKQGRGGYGPWPACANQLGLPR